MNAHAVGGGHVRVYSGSAEQLRSGCARRSYMGFADLGTTPALDQTLRDGPSGIAPDLFQSADDGRFAPAL